LGARKGTLESPQPHPEILVTGRYKSAAMLQTDPAECFHHQVCVLLIFEELVHLMHGRMQFSLSQKFVKHLKGFVGLSIRKLHRSHIT